MTLLRYSMRRKLIITYREAKRGGAAEAALPRLIVYLAAIQDSRKRAGKVNCSVFGVMTDSRQFVFVFLDESRKLFVSNTLSWLNQDTTIVKWIDKILEDAIKSSAHTSPVKGYQVDRQTYQAELKKWLSFGPEDVRSSSTFNYEGLILHRVLESDEESGIVTPVTRDEPCYFSSPALSAICSDPVKGGPTP
jgi:hypothetical protein